MECPTCGCRDGQWLETRKLKEKTRVHKQCAYCGRAYWITLPVSHSQGVPCPRCDCRELIVNQTRRDRRVIMRERQCRACGRVFWTTEVTASKTVPRKKGKRSEAA